MWWDCKEDGQNGILLVTSALEMVIVCWQSVMSAGEAGAVVISGLVNYTIIEGVTSAEWELRSIVNCFKGKGDALRKENCRVGINRSDFDDSILTSRKGEKWTLMRCDKVESDGIATTITSNKSNDNSINYNDSNNNNIAIKITLIVVIIII